MKNVGTIDKILRIVVGLGLLALVPQLGIAPESMQTVWGFVGIVPLATALIGWCPAYTLFGIRTCPAPN